MSCVCIMRRLIELFVPTLRWAKWEKTKIYITMTYVTTLRSTLTKCFPFQLSSHDMKSGKIYQMAKKRVYFPHFLFSLHLKPVHHCIVWHVLDAFRIVTVNTIAHTHKLMFENNYWLQHCVKCKAYYFNLRYSIWNRLNSFY